jgi:hypothetical protein
MEDDGAGRFALSAVNGEFGAFPDLPYGHALDSFFSVLAAG